jgi:hypothetical protein
MKTNIYVFKLCGLAAQFVKSKDLFTVEDFENYLYEGDKNYQIPYKSFSALAQHVLKGMQSAKLIKNAHIHRISEKTKNPLTVWQVVKD